MCYHVAKSLPYLVTLVCVCVFIALCAPIVGSRSCIGGVICSSCRLFACVHNNLPCKCHFLCMCFTVFLISCVLHFVLAHADAISPFSVFREFCLRESVLAFFLGLYLVNPMHMDILYFPFQSLYINVPNMKQETE